MAKFKAGDEVTVRAKILKVEIDSLAVGITSEDGEATHYTHGVPFSEIATHTPKPREFKPGDMVTWGIGTMPAEFIAERNGFAIMWVPRHRTVERKPISTLRYADEKDEDD